MLPADCRTGPGGTPGTPGHGAAREEICPLILAIPPTWKTVPRGLGMQHHCSLAHPLPPGLEHRNLSL